MTIAGWIVRAFVQVSLVAVKLCFLLRISWIDCHLDDRIVHARYALCTSARIVWAASNASNTGFRAKTVGNSWELSCIHSIHTITRMYQHMQSHQYPVLLMFAAKSENTRSLECSNHYYYGCCSPRSERTCHVCAFITKYPADDSYATTFTHYGICYRLSTILIFFHCCLCKTRAT